MDVNPLEYDGAIFRYGSRRRCLIRIIIHYHPDHHHDHQVDQGECARLGPGCGGKSRRGRNQESRLVIFVVVVFVVVDGFTLSCVYYKHINLQKM